MTELSMGFLRDDPRRLQTRLSVFVAERATAKQLARMLDSDVRTAENIRRGHWPQAKHFAAIVRAFGQDVIDAVFSEELDDVEARLEREERSARKAYLAARAARQASIRAPKGAADSALPFEDLEPSFRAPEPRTFREGGER